MPRVTLRAPDGMGYQCDSMDLKLIEQWFAETLPKVWDAHYPATFYCHPMWHWVPRRGNYDPDWPTDTRVFTEWTEIHTKDPATALQALIDARDRGLKRQRELHAEDERTGRNRPKPA